MKVHFAALRDTPTTDTTAVVVLVYDGGVLSAEGHELDSASGGTLSRVIRTSRFTGALGQVLSIPACPGVDASSVVLLGAGFPEQLNSPNVEQMVGRVYDELKASGLHELVFRFDHLAPSSVAYAALGTLLASYRFGVYRTRDREDERPSLKVAYFISSDPEAASKAFEPLQGVHEGVSFARDLVSEPGNVLFPAAFAERLVRLRSFGLEVEILDEAQMTTLGMGALLGVGQGSARESKLAVMRWQGARSDSAPVVLVGKGVTFDTGGISIKEWKGMEEMKTDMGGAAAVAGTMLALASRRAKVNVVAVLGLVENMPDGNAQRPGDIVTSMSGQTIEIVNTDAEGRLVLADALWYAQQRFKPRAIVDLATLTGAVVIALGTDYAGLCSNDDALAGELSRAGDAEQELVWRLPMPASYDKLHDTLIADMKNVGGHPDAGAITAALFLQRFVRDVPWAHLDIAGVVWRQKPDALRAKPEGATGFGVRLLNRWIATCHED